MHERREDSSSSVADPKPCHLILPNLSSRNIYLQSNRQLYLYNVQSTDVNEWQLKGSINITQSEDLGFEAFSWSHSGHQMNKQSVVAD